MTDRKDRRRAGHRRWVSGADVDRVHVRPGRIARLVNVSDGGALLEDEHPFAPGSSIELRISRNGGVVPISGRVVRCVVTRLHSDGISYQFAVCFDGYVALAAGGDGSSAGLAADENTGSALPDGRPVTCAEEGAGATHP